MSQAPQRGHSHTEHEICFPSRISQLRTGSQYPFILTTARQPGTVHIVRNSFPRPSQPFATSAPTFLSPTPTHHDQPLLRETTTTIRNGRRVIYSAMSPRLKPTPQQKIVAQGEGLEVTTRVPETHESASINRESTLHRQGLITRVIDGDKKQSRSAYNHAWLLLLLHSQPCSVLTGARFQTFQCERTQPLEQRRFLINVLLWHRGSLAFLSGGFTEHHDLILRSKFATSRGRDQYRYATMDESRPSSTSRAFWILNSDRGLRD